MALRSPLVIVGGQVQQLQPGDTLNAPQTGGNVVVQTNDEAISIVIGTPVYNDANDGVKRAQANASATKDCIGLVSQASIGAGLTGTIQTDGVLSATTTQWDAVAGTTGGLTKGQKYWLDPATAGKITATAPSTAGQYVVIIGIAISPTELLLDLVPGHDVLL